MPLYLQKVGCAGDFKCPICGCNILVKNEFLDVGVFVGIFKKKCPSCKVTLSFEANIVYSAPSILKEGV